MRLHRFIFNFDLKEKIFIQEKNLIHQILNVLRLKKGSYLVLVNSNLKIEALFEIININTNFIELRFMKILNSNSSDNLEINLFLAILKKENFELVCQKVTEIGARRIFPILTSRTVKKDIQIERVLKIIKEATEQSGRLDAPILEDILKVEDLFSLEILKTTFNLVFHPSGEEIKEFAKKKEKDFQNKNISIFIGPEGGFTEIEVEMFKKNGFYILSLGKNILRSETAAILSVYLVHFLSKA
jgi:16S rRNA (uracil1498-N3)-methyltransferase